LIKKFSYKLNDNILQVDTLVACGSKDNLSAQLLGEFIRDNIQGANKEAFIDIERQNMFAYRERNLFHLMNTFIKRSVGSVDTSLSVIATAESSRFAEIIKRSKKKYITKRLKIRCSSISNFKSFYLFFLRFSFELYFAQRSG
jgi:hypothetical protein